MVCKNFKYPALFEHFEKISSIPRASYHEEKIAEYLVSFAKERGLEYYTDSARNVLINIPATAGCEGRAPILLQGHTDMVCEKNIGVEHDFLSDGIELYEEDGFLKARGTTLGADDGTAIAIMLALLNGDIERHPACQCLFTASEEVGLDGAKAFDYSRIFARRMINMDGAEEKYLIVGCAGGMRSDSIFDIEFSVPKYSNVLKITIGGLMGGHSGENINDGRANANKLMGVLLDRILLRGKAEIVSFDGGSKDNAIPREAVAILTTDDVALIKDISADFEGEIKVGLCKDDADFFVLCEKIDDYRVEKVFSEEFSRRILSFVNEIENGVLAMSQNIEGLVEFSRNLGIVKTEGEKIGFYLSSRSAIDAQIEESAERIEGLAKRFGGVTEHHSRYPGWHFTGESALADRYIESAKRVCGMTVEKTVLHAGLECGIVKEALPDIEIISCGADVHDLHSPMERLNLASFERFFEIIKDIIENY